MESAVQIDYYTDILCVWAWIAERRNDEVRKRWGDRVGFRHLSVNVFGDTSDRIGRRWQDRGGFDGFAGHVVSSAGPYETAPVNPDIWRKVRPATSATAHLALKAAGLVKDARSAAGLAGTLRTRFFVDARDIGDLEVVLGIAHDEGFDVSAMQSAIDSGEAMAALMADYEQAKRTGVTGSPSWVLNDGRQVLYGNVGFRLINANIEELAKRPEGEASWC